MELEYSEHWKSKKKYRLDISDDLILYAITYSNALRDKHWPDALNAICRVPPPGRIIKVVYKKTGKEKYKVITAYWLD